MFQPLSHAGDVHGVSATCGVLWKSNRSELILASVSAGNSAFAVGFFEALPYWSFNEKVRVTCSAFRGNVAVFHSRDHVGDVRQCHVLEHR